MYKTNEVNNDNITTYYEYTEELINNDNEKNILNLLNKNGISLYTEENSKLNYISNATSLKHNTFDNIIKGNSIVFTFLRKEWLQKTDEEKLKTIDEWIGKNGSNRQKIEDFKVIKGEDKYVINFLTKNSSTKKFAVNILTVKKNDKLIELLCFEKQTCNNFQQSNLSIKFSDTGQISKIECFDKNRQLIHCFDIDNINNIINDEDKEYINNTDNLQELKLMLQYFLFITCYLNLNINLNIFINNFVKEIQESIDKNNYYYNEIYSMCNSIFNNLELSENKDFDKKITLLNGLNRDYKYSISENNGKTSFLDANGNVINTKLNGYVKSNSWLGCCCSCVPNDENNVDLYQQEISLIDNKEAENQEIEKFLSHD